MAAPKSKKTTKSAIPRDTQRKSVQIIVFAPANAEADEQENLTYMVCPSSLKVIDVVEKFDDEAEEYINLLNKDRIKSTVSSKTFIDDLAKTIDIENGLMTSEEMDEVHDLNNEELESVRKLNEDGLDEDIIAFASEELGEPIFGDEDVENLQSKVSDVDIADIMIDLDKVDDDSDLKGLVEDLDQDGALPEL